MKLSDPRYNLREIAKQMILLEEHLLVKSKYCPDCITKHLLTIEALADEAQCLDREGCWCQAAKQVGGMARRWASMFSVGNAPRDIGQEVRDVRKQISQHALDPQGRGLARRNSAHLVTYSGADDFSESKVKQYLPLVAAIGLAATAYYLYQQREDDGSAYLDRLATEEW
jgi:hypothetical protein